MNETWLIKRGEKYTRYFLHPYDCVKLYTVDGTYTRCFFLEKYYGEDDNWNKWGNECGVYVDIKTLLSEFILVDSPTDKYIKHLEELRDNNFNRQVETNISLFTDAIASIQGKTNTDETGKEDIRPLHSGEPEIDETGSTK